MAAMEIDLGKLVGGTEADRRRVLERMHEYLEINGLFDWRKLPGLWSDAPEAVFFNLNGHTYKGIEHWTRLWQFYEPNVKSCYWTPAVPLHRPQLFFGAVALKSSGRELFFRLNPGP
jgi:hypothetical protein